MKQTLFYACMLSLYSLTAWGQAQRVKTSAPSGIFSERESMAVNNHLFMAHLSGKLSVTDGTDAGTMLLVQDIAPCDLTPAGNLLVFTANDGTHGRELWVSDGTVSGTHMLADINPSGSGIITDTSCSSKLGNLVSAGNKVFFRADDGVHGSELWQTDGTAAGTFMVKDINPYGNGTPASACYTGTWGAPLGNLFYFSASDSTHGNELWTTDGSAAGTYMVSDLAPGSFSSAPASFHTAGTRMFFSALDANCLSYLYVSDGSTAGTHQIAANVSPTYYATAGNAVFFIGINQYDLYKIDAQNNVSLVTDTINILPRPSDNITYTPLVACNNGIFYLRRNNAPSSDFYLMRMDAATGTTSIVKTTANPIGQPIAAGNKLWFKSINADNTCDLYYSDGTAAGTQKIAYPNQNRYILSNPIIKAYVYYGVLGTMGNQIFYTMMYDSTSNLELYKTSIFPTGISFNNPVPEKIMAFPNPAQTSLTITGNHITGIRVYNTTGVLVKTQQTDREQQAHSLNIENLPPGIYLLTAETGEAQTISIRFEKQ